MVGDRVFGTPLTDEERALIEQYHNIIYRVLYDKGMFASLSDIYGDAALMLMVTARRYLGTPRLQAFSFTTIAYKQIAKVCMKYKGAKKAHDMQTVSLDDEDLKLYFRLKAPDDIDSEPDAAKELVNKRYALLMGLLTQKEQEAVLRHADGLNSTQVNKVYGVHPRTHTSAVERARIKAYAHYGEIWDTDEVVECPKLKSKRRISEEEGARIKEMYNSGMKVFQISKRVGRQPTVIKAYLIREGVIDG